MTSQNQKFSRRDFFSIAFAEVVSAGLLGFQRNAFAGPGLESAEQISNKTVIHRTLGKTGIKIPIVNMGVMNADNPELVRKSYEIGVRLFDTAASYQRGRNEEMVGKVLKDLNARDQAVIVTKVLVPSLRERLGPDKQKTEFVKMAEGSLKRLKTDYVDVILLHDVSSIEDVNNPGVKEAMQVLKDQKKARFVGFSTHNNMAACLDEAAKTDFYDVLLVAFNYALSDDSKLYRSLSNAVSKGIGILAMKTQCSQYWYRDDFVPDTKRRYYGKIMHAAVLKWVLQHDFIAAAVPGYTTFDQMEEDFSVAYDLTYNPEEKKFLEDSQVKLSLAYCRQCNSCLPTCPKGVNIPALMRTHLYAACYANFYQARDTFDSIPKEKGIQVCASCGSCLAICAHRIDIPQRIDELRALYV